MNELHLFAGAGGGILGGILLGHTCVCAVEIEPYCRKVLLQRQRDGILPKFPIWDDVRTFDARPWSGKVDAVCGGFPCQEISLASGRQANIGAVSDGSLWKQMVRVVCAVRPKWVFVENSPALVIRGLGTILRDLATLGFNARWGVFSAADTGALHIRERIWILAHSNEERLQWGIRSDGGGKNGHLKKFPTFPFLRQDTPNDMPKPRCVRKANEMDRRMDRLKAIGNGQVPAVVKLAWETLATNL